MPELTRQFGDGAMNKDLDERLVPNGSYRDALNIQASSSEGSDIGTVQNILGNKRPYGSALSNLGNNPSCIGVHVNPKTEMIYWFIASDSKSIILEYDQTLNVVSPILIDTQSILNFSTVFRITGINIIDNLLFWSDDKTEPKKINLDKWKIYNTSNSSYTHTQINSSNFIEDDITVIKKSPIKPPTIVMSATKRTGIVETTLLNRAFTETSGDFNPIDTGNYGNVTFTLAANYEVGDKLRATLLDESSDEEAILSVTAVIGGPIFTLNLDVVSTSIEEGLQDWKIELIEEKPMFEFKFPQFSYRYKYDDNEYSAIGPWSKVAFLPDPFDYNPKKGYNKGMVNTLRSLKIGGFTQSAPNGVKEIDILYKESSNNNIYTVQSIKTSDDEYTAGTNGEVEITSDVIYKVLPSIQSLRHWDNVPRKAKAQAMSANRIMYGNYIENFNMIDAGDSEISVKFKVAIVQNPSLSTETRVPKPSIKSLRTYQVGVVYVDKYGRETPIFTDPSGSLILDKMASINYNVISIRIVSTIPEWAESYKYFIKESSDEYYNLAMDRHYPAEDGNAWIAFPSAERNKVTEETFLILKKRHDDDTFVDDPARYKIIAISNEAPPFLKIERVTKGLLQSSNSGSGNTAESIFMSAGYPQPDTNSVHIEKAKWIGVFGGGDNDYKTNVIPVHQLSNLTCRVKGSGNQTKWYDIANIKYFDGGSAATRYYEVEIEDKFAEDDVSFIPTTHSSSDTSLSFEIAQKTEKSEPEFAGRFFAKIERDGVLEQAILNNQNVDDYRILASSYTYALTGHTASQNYWRNTEKGVYPGATGTSNSAEWYFCRNTYRHFKWANGPLITDGVKERGGLGGVTGHSSAHNVQGFGAQAGNDYMEIAYHRWGDSDRDAWTGFWNKFTSQYRTQFKNMVNAMETVNTKFRFQDDPDQEVYTIKGWSKSYIGAFKDGKIGRWGSMRVIKWTLKLDKPLIWVPEDNNKTTKATASRIEFLDVYADGDEAGFSSDNPAIFETEPKEVPDLNLYYEASEAYNKSVHGNEQTLDYSNCFSFANGVESDRIRDDYNAAKLSKGIKANTILEKSYAEERQTNKVIFSGLYNSTSGTNNTNQFIQADDITKVINPTYGSIQLMRHRHGGLDVLCEDKCFKIQTEKDLLFTADGSKQVTVSSNVLSPPVPYTGEFGISKNPESYCTYGYRAYFSDKARGVILRLSNDGLEPISRYGMEDYFRDNLAASTTIIGSYDTVKKEFNVTLNHDTVSFKEDTNKWASRKSYIQEDGVSLNNIYYTFKDGQLWSHDNEIRNNFYDTQYNSTIKLIFNDAPGTVKQFKTLNYEGTQSRIFVDNDTNADGISNADTDNYFPNRATKAGWWSNNITSDKQDGQVLNFEEKEGKWFNFIQGTQIALSNLDTSEFSVQGLGDVSAVTASGDYSYAVTITVNENAD